MTKTFEELYNSAIGIVSTWKIDNENEFDEAFEDLYNNLDMTFVGQYDKLQDADEEFMYQGLSLDNITKYSMNRYGTVIEVLEFESQYFVFYGQR